MTLSLRAREALGLTQAQLAALLDVHAITVSKWERSILIPSAWQEAILHNFRYAATKRPGIGAEVARLMAERGVIVALYTLLHVSLGDVR